MENELEDLFTEERVSTSTCANKKRMRDRTCAKRRELVHRE